MAPADDAAAAEQRPDIVLVRPRDFGAVPPDAPVQDPLGVGLLAAALRQNGYSVLILDAHALGVDDDGLVACIAELRPPIVGLSLHSFSDYSHCAAISKQLRKLPEPPYCMWGGEHATFHAERILRQHPEVDAVVLGEGEETVAQLAELLLRYADARDSRALAEGVPGALVRGVDGRPVDAGYRRAIENLDALPDAHKDVVELALRMGRHVSVSVLTGRGCTHSCRFCTANTFMRLGGGVVWRRRSPLAVADEVERLAKRYLGHPLVHPVLQFQDVIFLGTSPASKRWVREYVEEMERRELRIPFYCMARADAIIANEDMLPRLVGIGLWSVEMGLESGVDRILKAYNKRNAAADNEHAVTLLRKHGVTFDASGFIMFDPQMTLDELRVNARYLARFGAATWDFFVTRLQLYPGTEVREEMIRKGAFDGEDDIGRTSGYVFDDPAVGLVAEHAFYYDMSIRTLDLALRDAKAVLADAVRRGEPANAPLTEAVNLVHDTYCAHLLTLTDLAETGSLRERFPELVAEFLKKVKVLTELLQYLLGIDTNARDAA